MPTPIETDRLVLQPAPPDDGGRGTADGNGWRLAVATRTDDGVVGTVTVTFADDGRRVELGCRLERDAWGNGYGRESVAATVDHLFTDPRVSRIGAASRADDPRSARMLENVGFVYEGNRRGSARAGNEVGDEWLYGLLPGDRERWLARPTAAPTAVRFVEVTPELLGPVIRLRTHHSQERFVSPNVISFAQALHPEPHEGRPVTPWYRAVEADGELVGFVMVDTGNDGEADPYLWRLMVERHHQRRGIGRRVLELVVDQCRSWGAGALDVSWGRGVGSPEPFYLAYGFVLTGRVVDGETEARLAIGTP